MGRDMPAASLLSNERWDSLDRLIKRVDLDRWLSSRYAPPAARRALVALYALNYELVRVRGAVSEPALGAIRYQWWRDALEELAAGTPPRRHDVALAAAELIQAGHHTAEGLLRLVDGHEDAFECADRSREPEATLMMMAARILAPAHGWGPNIQELAPAFAAARRGPTKAYGPVVPTVPGPIRPAIAHACLREPYARGREPGELGRRIRVFRAMVTGRV